LAGAGWHLRIRHASPQLDETPRRFVLFVFGEQRERDHRKSDQVDEDGGEHVRDARQGMPDIILLHELSERRR